MQTLCIIHGSCFYSYHLCHNYSTRGKEHRLPDINSDLRIDRAAYEQSCTCHTQGFNIFVMIDFIYEIQSPYDLKEPFHSYTCLTICQGPQCVPVINSVQQRAITEGWE